MSDIVKDRVYWNKLWRDSERNKPFAVADAPRRRKRILGNGTRYERGGFRPEFEDRP